MSAKKQKILVCLPGHPDQTEWVAQWDMMFLHLVQHFDVVVRRSASNNIYLTRHILAREAEALNPDYVLWIDSDNPPTVDGFDLLYVAMEHTPDVSILGGWYFYPMAKGIGIAAGYRPDTFGNMITLDKIESATSLIEVDYIGLGFCLMRGQVFQVTKPDHFVPIIDPNSEYGFMTDDAGFCKLACDRGYKTYLHPAVRVEHLKVMKVPAPSPGQTQTKEGVHEDGDYANSSHQRTKL